MLFQVLCGFEPIFYTTHPNEESQNLGILDSSIKLNEGDCNEVKQKIDRVIELKRIYEKSKSKAVNEKRVLNSVD